MDWLMILPLIALLPHLLCAMVQGQPSPCSEYFTYMAKPGITDMLGQIEIPPPSVNDEFYLKVALTTTTESPSQVVRLELAQSVQESVLAVSFGSSLLYHIYYPTHEPTPSLSAIWFNNQRYCPDPHANSSITATIELGHILYPLNEQPLVYNYGTWQQISQPWHRNSSIYRIDNPSYDRLNYESQLNNECGITSYYTDETNSLISDGEKTLPGQWPWLVAIYIQRTDNESVYDFQCAGSLLTTRHVITAKDCIMVWDSGTRKYRFIEPLRVYASFGQFKSREWHGNHTGIINRVIAKYMHKPRYDNRLVILNLKTAIEYNGFIRSICLWSGSTNLRDIVNMTGYIAGWGYEDSKHRSDTSIWFPDHLKNYTAEPRTGKMPIMNISDTRNGDLKYLEVQPLDFEYNIPCDLGGGLVVFNITTGRYQLRGVAELCRPVSSTTRYMDVADKLSWIREQIDII